MADNFSIQFKGLDQLNAKLKKVGTNLSSYMSQAASEASKDLLANEGLQKYPPAGPANQPPTPYYKRGTGMQYKYGNDGRSERLGTKFTVTKISFGAKIGNTASYAPHVVGENQAKHMGSIGWLSLPKFAKEKINEIRATFDAWIKKVLKDSNLT